MVTLVRAPNPSAMTLTGTNSYIVDCAGGEALVIDPGPLIARHVDALVETAHQKGLKITAIAVTHGHPDHAPAAASLAARTGAPVHAHPASRIPHDVDLTLEGALQIGRTALQTMDAPGHTFDHVVFYLPEARALFTGDVILGEGTVVIAPPGGAMRPYQRTLRRLAVEFSEARKIYGGHGPVVEDAQAKIAEYIAHREMRERQVLDALADGARTIPEIVASLYGPERQVLWPAMARQVLAHLEALENEGRVSVERADRAMTSQEASILNPPLAQLVGPEEAALIAEELGASLRIDGVDRYSLRR